jgi:hypothetical protein
MKKDTRQLIQLLLPLYSPEGEIFPASYFSGIREALTARFGGITTYARSPATGLWKENEAKTVRDELVIYEVLAPEVDRHWWRTYKQDLEKTFRQQEILIRAWEVTLL